MQWNILCGTVEAFHCLGLDKIRSRERTLVFEFKEYIIDSSTESIIQAFRMRQSPQFSSLTSSVDLLVKIYCKINNGKL